MNKTELIDAVAASSGLTKVAAASAVDATLATISTAVSQNDEVRLSGFGIFKASQRPARTARNPRTGEPIKIAATKVPRFTAGAAFKAAVGQKK